MSARRPPRALRARLLLAIVTGLGVLVVALTTTFNVVLGSSLDRDADDLVRARADAELGGISLEGGRISLPGDLRGRTSLATRAWVFEGRRALQAPTVAAELDRAARELAGGPERIVDVSGGDVRMYALPVTVEGRRLGTVVAGVSLVPYNRTRLIALIASVALAVLVLGAVAAAAAWILRAALRPVARMTADAAAWSEHDLDKRFAVGPPHDEITRLAATLDGLLDRLAAGLRRERRFTAEVSHELRTPLAQIRAEAELALRRTREPEEYRRALEAVREGAGRLAETVETLLAMARHDSPLPRGTGDAHRAAERAAGACARLAAERGVALRLEPPDRQARTGVEDVVVERILQPIVENASRLARSEVRVAISAEDGSVVVSVTDDGPGVAPEDAERIFEPGRRGGADEDRPAPGSAGLGLALARRLARAASGDVEAHPDPAGGRFTVRLPGA